MREDTKPCFFGQQVQYLQPAPVSRLPDTQPKRQGHMQNILVNPVLSALAANMSALLSSAPVQKVSPVRPQTYSCTRGRQLDSSAKTCIVAANHIHSHIPPSPRCSSDRTRPVHSGSRNISVVKPASSSVVNPQPQVLATPVMPAVTDNRSLQTLLPSQLIHNHSSRYNASVPTLFDTCRTDRGLPLAQVYPSRVVTSTAQNETVPSPIHCTDELQSKPPLTSTQLPDKNCPVVCASSNVKTTKISSDFEPVASHPVFTSCNNCNFIKSPVSIAAVSSDVSPPVPILSPIVLSSSSTDHATSPAVSPDLYPSKSTCGKGILPPIDTSPISLSDRESIPDEDGSGHDLSTTLWEWDDNVSVDRKDFDVCLTEELPTKQPAFEVVDDCNRMLLTELSQPCYAVAAFDRSLFENESDHRDFIARTKFYRYFSRRVSAAGSGPHDVELVQPDADSSPNVSPSTSKVSQTTNASAAVRQITLPSSGKDGIVKDTGTISRKYGGANTESKCRRGSLGKKAKKLQHHGSLNVDSDGYEVVGSVYSTVSNSKQKSGNRVTRSSLLGLVKSELVEDSTDSESKPSTLSRTVCRRRRKDIPSEITTDVFNSFDQIVGSVSEADNTVSDLDEDSCRHSRSSDEKVTVQSVYTTRLVSKLVSDCQKIEHSSHYDQTKVRRNSSRVQCDQEMLMESTVMSGSARSNPKTKVLRCRQRKPGDANNNQGKINSLVLSSSSTSSSEPEPSLIQTSSSETVVVDGSEPVRQTAKVPRHMRDSTVLSDTIASCSHHQSTSDVSKQQHSKSDETVMKRTFSTSDTHRRKFGLVRQLNKCTRGQSVDTADLNVSRKSGVIDVQHKSRRSILKQLESSDGYIAEKNVRYSKSEDLFDDSSLLSREQRALQVSYVPACTCILLSFCH